MLNFPEFGIVASFSNADQGGYKINRILQKYAQEFPAKFVLKKSFGSELNYNLMKHASVLVGNSSSGLIEAQSFELPVVNVGDRQKGRKTQKNVINATVDVDQINSAVNLAMSEAFRESIKGAVNLFKKPDTASKIAEAIVFYDIPKAKPFNDLDLMQ